VVGVIMFCRKIFEYDSAICYNTSSLAIRLENPNDSSNMFWGVLLMLIFIVDAATSKRSLKTFK